MARVSEKRVGIAVLNILAARPRWRGHVEILKAELPKHLVFRRTIRRLADTDQRGDLGAAGPKSEISRQDGGKHFNDGFV